MQRDSRLDEDTTPRPQKPEGTRPTTARTTGQRRPQAPHGTATTSPQSRRDVPKTRQHPLPINGQSGRPDATSAVRKTPRTDSTAQIGWITVSQHAARSYPNIIWDVALAIRSPAAALGALPACLRRPDLAGARRGSTLSSAQERSSPATTTTP